MFHVALRLGPAAHSQDIHAARHRICRYLIRSPLATFIHLAPLWIVTFIGRGLAVKTIHACTLIA